MYVSSMRTQPQWGLRKVRNRARSGGIGQDPAVQGGVIDLEAALSRSRPGPLAKGCPSGTLRVAADLTCDATIERESNHDRFSAHRRSCDWRTCSHIRWRHCYFIHAISLPVTSVQEIAGSAPTEQVRWGGGWGGFRGGGYGFRGYGFRGYGWGGYGGGWRRPYYGGGALAAGLVGGLALGTLAASTGSYYGYGYPSYYGSGYGYYPSSYYHQPTTGTTRTGAPTIGGLTTARSITGGRMCGPSTTGGLTTARSITGGLTGGNPARPLIGRDFGGCETSV